MQAKWDQVENGTVIVISDSVFKERQKQLAIDTEDAMKVTVGGLRDSEPITGNDCQIDETKDRRG